MSDPPAARRRPTAAPAPAGRAAAWAAVALAVLLVGAACGRAGVPSSYLFSALLVGLAVALGRPGALAVHPSVFTCAQAAMGVVLGTYLESAQLGALQHTWLPVLLVSLATLALTIAAGLVLARTTGVDSATASLGMVAGGASGIVAMAGELGGDDRLVAFMQYLRVLVIVVLTPLIVSVAFGGVSEGSVDPSAGEPVLGTPLGWAFTLLVAAAGVVAGRRLRVPAGSLLVPLVVAATVSLTGVLPGANVPPLLRETAFALIGLQVGLRFTPATLRTAGRLILPVVVSILAMVAVCFVLAWLLTLTTDVSLLDGYLATTPGGLYAVLATAFGVRADTTFVLAVQALRLFVMLLAAPPIVRWIVARSVGAPDRLVSR
jgi:membrane AbrB-like protein